MTNYCGGDVGTAAVVGHGGSTPTSMSMLEENENTFPLLQGPDGRGLPINFVSLTPDRQRPIVARQTYHLIGY